jgi:uncharacterized protein YndB with AHSA1/START domain
MPEGKLQRDGESVTLRYERTAVASVAATWSALVEPSILKEWLAEAEIDPRVGGAVHLVWPGRGEMRGTVQAIDAPSVIEYTWDESDGSSLVRFEVAASGDAASSLRLIHSGTSLEGAPGFGAGWQSHLEALDVVLAGGESTTEQRNERYEELHPGYLEAVAQLEESLA